MLRTLLLLVVMSCAANTASAQDPFALEQDAHRLADASYTRDVGAGLTLGGLAATGLGVGLMFGINGFENYGGLIAGGVFEGLGGLLALIGIPTWIIGGVRSDVLSHPYDQRAEVAWGYELAGMITTITSIAMCIVGGSLLFAGISASQSGSALHDAASERSYDQMVTAGLIMLPIGYFLGTFIGSPLWGEGARF